MFSSFVKRDPPQARWRRLAQVKLFSTLSPRELRTVNGLLHERDYAAGEVVFDEGEEGQAIYIVLSGRVEIRRQGWPADGHIADLGPGDFFGDLALLDNAPRVAQARAADDCRLAVFFRGDFMGLLDSHAVLASKISLQLARHIGQRLREMTVGRPTGESL